MRFTSFGIFIEHIHDKTEKKGTKKKACCLQFTFEKKYSTSVSVDAHTFYPLSQNVTYYH